MPEENENNGAEIIQGPWKKSKREVKLPDKGVIKLQETIDFVDELTQTLIVQMIHTIKENEIDVECTVKGGGLSGQAGAIRLGIARCLEQINPEYRGQLKEAGMLTRDSREVERKKYGQPGARKKFQFSKR